jgi:hypothetical protein
MIVAFQPRPWLVVVSSRLEQLFEGTVVDLLRQQLLQLLLARVEEVDPLGHGRA